MIGPYGEDTWFTDGRYNNADFGVEQFDLSYIGTNYPYFKIQPPTLLASEFNGVANNLCYNFASAVDTNIYSWDGDNNLELLVAVQAADITEGQFT